MTDVNGASNDYCIPDKIEDTIQVIKFHPNKNLNLLIGGGWDKKVYLWEISYSQNTSYSYSSSQIKYNSKLINQVELQSEVLDIDWNTQNETVAYIGCVDGSIYRIDFKDSSLNIINKHVWGTKAVCYSSLYNCLFTGAWDGIINIFNVNDNYNLITKYDCQRRIYGMSLKDNLLCFILDCNLVGYFNLQKLNNSIFESESIFLSSLKYQTRSISVFTEVDGFAYCSIEGRLAIKYINFNSTPIVNSDGQIANNDKDYTFKCHRVTESTTSNIVECYSVNCVSFNNAYGTLCTGGSDGTWSIWDKDSRSKLKGGIVPNKSPVVSCSYNSDGSLLAYSTGYDWSKGVMFDKTIEPKIYIHYCLESDRKKKIVLNR